MTVTRLDFATFNWWEGTGGAAEVRAIARAADEDNGHENLNEAAILTLQNHGLGTAVLLLAEGGFAYIHGLSGPGRPELDLVVTPEMRGKGIGTELMAAVDEVIDGIPVTAWSHGNHPAASALATRSGFESVRELWMMRRPRGPIAPADLPAGYALRTFVPGADDKPFLAVNAAAFEGHPEQGELEVHGLAERMAESWFDAEGFFLAEETSAERALTGFHWTKHHVADKGIDAFGEVYVIGVHPSAQGTGLGRSLLVAGLEYLQQQPIDEIVLYVEASNETAIGLYNAYDFTHVANDTHIMFARH